MVCKMLIYMIVFIPIIISCFIFKKKKIKFSKLGFTLYLIVMLVIMYFLSLIPLEYIFMEFNTVEEAFRYSYPNMEITKLYETEEYSIIHYKRGDYARTITGVAFFEKKKDKWTGVNNLMVKGSTKIVNGAVIDVYKIPKYKDIYLDIKYYNDLENVIDSNGKVYNCTSTDVENEYYNNHCDLFIENIKDDFYITINDYQVRFD